MYGTICTLQYILLDLENTFSINWSTNSRFRNEVHIFLQGFPYNNELTLLSLIFIVFMF